jgi:hypothetical protein
MRFSTPSASRSQGRSNPPCGSCAEPSNPRTLEPSGLWDRRTSESFDRRTTGACSIWGTPHHVSAPDAALANGTAAHALDFDDMCFVSLAHPSAPLVPAIIAAGEMVGASGRAVLDAYVVVSKSRPGLDG